MTKGTSGGSGLVRSVLADQVQDWLLQRILDGTYQPDARIVETQVARVLNTSQAPVREALRGLEALGLIEITAFRGARVRRPTRDELVEAYVVRSELESLAARLAIPNMTEADLRELIHYGAQMHKAARVGDGHAVATADANFHAKIVEMTGNGTLKRLWGTLEPFSRTYITLVMPGADPLWSARLHDPIVDALRGRDVRAVVRALRRHFADASSMLATHWLDAERSASAPETSPTAAGGGSNTGSSRGDVGRPKPNRLAAPE